jgi:hypothetical protein
VRPVPVAAIDGTRDARQRERPGICKARLNLEQFDPAAWWPGTDRLDQAQGARHQG